ncbi:MAG: hypothetical protein MK110_03595 [Fuerstiella sp.]|nr:hypothetical protein [Fuerstiella sp.]
MPNSLWKLISIVGVIAIGSLVVKEVHEGLSIGDTASNPLNDTSQTEGRETLLTADPSQSALEGQLSADLRGNQQPDSDPLVFGESNQVIHDEHDHDQLVSVNNSFSGDHLTENRDPLAVDSVTAKSDPRTIPSDTRPTQTASFAEESDSVQSTQSDIFDFTFEPDIEDAADSSKQTDSNEVTVSSFEVDGLDVPPPISEPFAETTDSDTGSPPSETLSDARKNPLLFLSPQDGPARSRVLSGEANKTSDASTFSEPFETDAVEPLNQAPPTSGLNIDAPQTPAPESNEGDLPPLPVEVPRTHDDDNGYPAPNGSAEDLMFGEDTDNNDSIQPFAEESSKRLPSRNSSFDQTTAPDVQRSVPDTTEERSNDFHSDLELPPARESDHESFPADSVLPDAGDGSPPFQLDSVDPLTNESPEFPPLPRRQNDDRNSDSRRIRLPDEVPPQTTTPQLPLKSQRRTSSSTGVLRPHLTVHKKMPDSATLGQPMDYRVVVTNEGKSVAENVVVEDAVPVAARVDTTDPPAEYNKETRSLIWKFEQLQAGDSRELIVRLTPTDQGVLRSIATVRFNAQLTTSTLVRAPNLKLEFKTPRPVRVGGETQLRYMVRNEGDGTAVDVVLRSDLPSGLRHPVGNDLEYSIDTLEPGTEREIILNVIAAEPGKFTTRAELLADGIPGDTAEVTVRVVGQQIHVIRQGPQRRYVGRSAVYSNILNNGTEFDASEIRVIERIPEGMKFERASHNGVYSPQQREVVWNVDRIQAGDQETLKIELTAADSGDQESLVTVIENAGFETAARTITAVEDLHNIGSRMSRLDGPVSVGSEFGFEIVAENRGTADATGIQLIIDLPEGVQGVSVGRDGPRADPKLNNGQLQYHFQPVKRIQPGKQKTFRINLKATQAISNGVVNARIHYDQMQDENALVMSESITASDDRP